ncbi:MAG: tail fiber protein [Kiritimatiellae bacterium]|nr:tail fiber protein [Kiritimatiellia bacterium]
MNAGSISATSLSVNGNISAGTSGTLSGYGSIPKGGIIMWSGAASNIPDGWALCNGQKVNGVTTPDLRDRFIAGAGNLYAVGEKGGQMSVTLTVAQMPRHSHEYVGDDMLAGIEPGCSTTLRETTTKYDADSTIGNGRHSHVYATSQAGNNVAHENRPPFYALCFIIRVK